MMFKVFNNNCQTCLKEQFHRISEVHNYNLRGAANYELQYRYLKRIFLNVLSLNGVQLSNQTREIKDLASFTVNLRYP